LGEALSYSVNAYYRRISTRTSNGDINDEALTESVYQPGAAERAALAGAGHSGFPASGANAANTPFPSWRCIANVLLNDEPNEKCNGLVNRTATLQHNLGITAQVSASPTLAGLEHRLLFGVGVDANRVRFAQSAQFGYVNLDRTVTPVNGPGAFADGSQESENAFDARVDIASRAHTVSVFASDTVTLNPRTHLTFSGRYNRHRVSTDDALAPGGGPGSLDGRHRFARFNPALGLSFAPTAGFTLYAGANQGSRAPSAVELGCADPLTPCKLPNSFAGDPPLKQVVTTTLEAGLRGSVPGRLAWNLGVFRSDNRDDLLFVSDNTSGFGYFRNFGKTRRQGLEAGLSVHPARDWTLGANLSLLDATWRSAERLGGSANSSNDAAAAGLPGLPGSIEIRAGDRIPLLPRRVLKLFADWDVTRQWGLGADLVASSGATARGNENGAHVPDGVFYTGPGRSAGYAVLNMNVDYRPSARLKLFVQVNNLLDRRYASAAQLGANAFDANGNFIARPLPPAANGEYPLRHGSFLAPGAPRGVWLGLRYAFGDA
ncbi:MAG: TonB-dependent receptor, partial [Pseudomonadota bacterium]